MISQSTIDIVKETAPVLSTTAEKITSTFYANMLSERPDIRPFFNASNQRDGRQARALANGLIAFANNIDNLPALAGFVARVANKHVSLQIMPAQYPVIGHYLVGAIKTVLGDAATDAVVSAWEEAYNALADILIAAEEKLYAAAARVPGGWRGVRRMQIVRKERESAEITSFYFRAADGKMLPLFRPGQYVTFALQGVRRNYSLSAAPTAELWRVSVKREQHGLISRHLHDNVNVGDELDAFPPAGDFVLDEGTRTLVLVTGGVGLTPAISMLLTAAPTGRAVLFLHCARNGAVHAFRRHVEDIAQKRDNVSYAFAYSRPDDGDVCDHRGRIDENFLKKHLKGETDVELYTLGTAPFMQSVVRMARKLGVPREQIHYEFFGPAQDIED